MITLHTSKLSDNLGFNGEDITVKSVSAAWNKIREIRDTTDPKVLNGTLLRVTGEKETELGDRIPSVIRFQLNKNGKILFKNAYKWGDVEEAAGPITNDPLVEGSIAAAEDPDTGIDC